MVKPPTGPTGTPGEGAPAGLRVLRLRRLAATGHQRTGLPAVRLRSLGESAWQLPREGKPLGPFRRFLRKGMIR